MSRKAIKLPSSYEELYYPNGDLEEGTLLDLLKEGTEKQLKDNNLVRVGYKRRIPSFDPDIDIPGDHAYFLKPVRMKFGSLKKLWRLNCWGASSFDKYTSENELQRSNYYLDVIRKRSTFPYAIGDFMKAMNQEVHRE